jgi:hypothetical protein
MYSRVLKSASRIALLALVALVPVALTAQDSAKPAQKAYTEDTISRWDIFAGYSYLAPIGSVNTMQLGGSIVPVTYNSVDYGGMVSAARYFNKYVGVEANFAGHPKYDYINDGFYNARAGLIFRIPSNEITPFVHVLIGADRIAGPDNQIATWGPTIGIGGGMDYATPFFNHHLAIRLFQYDYSYAHVNYGANEYEGRANPKLNELSAGFVYHIGSLKPPPPVTLTCKAAPEFVYPGTDVVITGTAGALNPKLTATYTWTGTNVTGDGANAKVDTANLAPGSYTVKGHVTEGVKPWMSADCTTNAFVVKEYEPPTISCSANPSTIKPGDSSTVTSNASSPQGRPLKITYSAAAGSIQGSGNTATFTATEGTPIDTISITCSVSDDKGHSASARTSVTVAAPYVPPVPKTSELCSITFGKKTQPIDRVDNEAKGCLDDVALNLQKQPDAKLVIIGEQNAAEEKLNNLGKKAKPSTINAQQRAVNTKAYLVEDKQIDASRISVTTDSGDGQVAKSILVPAGATFNSAGTMPVDESKVKPQSRTRAQAHAAALAAAKAKKPATTEKKTASKKKAAPAAK